MRNKRREGKMAGGESSGRGYREKKENGDQEEPKTSLPPAIFLSMGILIG